MCTINLVRIQVPLAVYLLCPSSLLLSHQSARVPSLTSTGIHPLVSPWPASPGPSCGQVGCPCSCLGRILEPRWLPSFPQHLQPTHQEILLDLPSKHARKLPAPCCPVASTLLPVSILLLRDFSGSLLFPCFYPMLPCTESFLAQQPG